MIDLMNGTDTNVSSQKQGSKGKVVVALCLIALVGLVAVVWVVFALLAVALVAGG